MIYNIFICDLEKSLSFNDANTQSFKNYLKYNLCKSSYTSFIVEKHISIVVVATVKTSVIFNHP